MGCHYFSSDIIGYRNPPRRFFTCGPMIQHRVGWAEGANVPVMPGSLRPASRPCPLWWTDSLDGLPGCGLFTPLNTSTHERRRAARYTLTGVHFSGQSPPRSRLRRDMTAPVDTKRRAGVPCRADRAAVNVIGAPRRVDIAISLQVSLITAIALVDAATGPNSRVARDRPAPAHLRPSPPTSAAVSLISREIGPSLPSRAGIRLTTREIGPNPPLAHRR